MNHPTRPAEPHDAPDFSAGCVYARTVLAGHSRSDGERIRAVDPRDELVICEMQPAQREYVSPFGPPSAPVVPATAARWAEPDCAYRFRNPDAALVDDEGYPAAPYFYRSTETGARESAAIVGATEIELSPRLALGAK
jgi:hypothetical protein